MNTNSLHTATKPAAGPQQGHSSAAAARLKTMLSSLFAGRDLTRSEASEVLGYILDGQATDAQIAAVLVMLAKKGESLEELVGLTEAMRARMVVLRTRHRCFIDTAGTGASRSKTFNISTAAALAAAAAGVPVAKHGARASTSKSGSADVLAALGAPVPVPVEVSEQVFDAVGFCFLFAPAHHPASARVSGIRRELGLRTCFNLIGPLSNPARSPRQLMGVSDEKLMPLMVGALSALGAEWAWVVHGSDGLDEVTLAGPTRVLEVCNGKQRALTLTPEDFGYRAQSLEAARAEDATASARIIRDVFDGKRRDIARDLIVVNAAAALYLGGAAGTLKQCAERALDAIESGLAAGKLEAFLAAVQAGITEVKA